jgi:aromatic-L-amino-acid decarboxylase
MSEAGQPRADQTADQSANQERALDAMHMSGGEFEQHARTIAAWIARYWGSVESMPVRSRVAPGEVFDALPATPPEEAQGVWTSLVDELDATVVPGLTHWQHPSFFGYFPANATGPAVLGELLSAGLGVQGMLWSTSPACTEIEMRVMDWLANAYGLPDDFTHAARLTGAGAGGGVIQSTASEATLVALVAARHRALRGLGEDEREPHLTLYASSEAHASVVKAAMIAGLARGAEDGRHVRRIATDPEGRMCVARLSEAMARDRAAGRVPCFVVGTLGTTGTGGFDDLAAIADVLDADARSNEAGSTNSGRRAWLHVDGAWGMNACVCPEHRGMLRGVDRVDSLCVNPHKWLLTNFDCDAFFVRDARAITDAMSITPEYLRPTAATGASAVTDFRDWQVPLGRRFRALKLWLVMRHYGLSGLREFIRSSLTLAERFEAWVREDARFAVHSRSLSLVCLRLVAREGESREGVDARTLALLERVNASGKAMITHTRAPGEGGPGPVVIRVAVGGVQTRERHCRGVWELLRENA